MKKWRAVFYMAPITREQALKNALASSRIEWGWSHRTDPCRLPPADGRQRRCPHLGCLNFCLFAVDYNLTTTVQWCCKMSKKPVVTTNNGLFLVLAVNVQNQQNSRFIAGLHHPVVVLRRQVPGVRIPSGAPRAAYYGCCSSCFLRIPDSCVLCPSALSR